MLAPRPLVLLSVLLQFAIGSLNCRPSTFASMRWCADLCALSGVGHCPCDCTDEEGTFSPSPTPSMSSSAPSQETELRCVSQSEGVTNEDCNRVCNANPLQCPTGVCECQSVIARRVSRSPSPSPSAVDIDSAIVGSLSCNTLTIGSTEGFQSFFAQPSGDNIYHLALNESALVTLATVDSMNDFDTFLTLFDGSRTPITANDDAEESHASRIAVPLLAGSYLVVVDGFSDEEGTYGLNVTCLAFSDVESFASGTVKCGESVTGSTQGHPSYFNSESGDNVYLLSLSKTEVVTLSLVDPLTNFDTMLTVFVFDSQLAVFQNDDFIDLQSQITAEIPEGMHIVVVDGYSLHEGTYRLSVTCGGAVPSPPAEPTTE